ncbi:MULTISPECIES: 2'-5' RNA ligase family protein [unclassified Arthrobacter]|uniref:2'-5' RNA ligase family protein n=1 Tax=unclassified Arthrobacter TaxID=235627 RepID=UPI00159D7A31|nr:MULTISPECIES: 2'-5' RNA ligase family protein [unclassified Arthrobacter]MCQ9164845.1 2'-5' RNA ligase family protein [Arthrobacter sp. STN4]NVN00323.1 2'-5' RNA ligase family protein [Arthrobacter sp. SDTb3-6]
MPGIGQSGASPAPHPESLGVVISMPPALAAELHAWRESYAGPGNGAVPAHITLVSGRARHSWDEAAEHVRKVAREGSPFTVSLRGTGTFAPVSPVVFLNVDRGAGECRKLHDELLAGPVEHLLDFGFEPHLTVAHDLDAGTMARAEAEMADFAAELEVNSIGLYDYAQGRWELYEELALGGDTTA